MRHFERGSIREGGGGSIRVSTVLFNTTPTVYNVICSVM